MKVSYSRISSEDLDKFNNYSTSIYNQIDLIRSYAKRIEIDIDKEYIDDGYSGANFDRPGFEELKEDIENGLISVLITKDFSRLGRNFWETVYYISEYFPRYNVRYISINDRYDSNNQDDMNQHIMLQFKSLVNDKFIRDVSIKRKQICELKTCAGQFIGAFAPYGYRIVKNNKIRTLEVDEYAAKIVNRIFNEISSGKSRKEVAIGLNNDKIKPPIMYLNMTLSNKKKYYYDWTDTIIYRILRNKTYLGMVVKRKSIKKDYHDKKRQYIKIRDRETIDNCHPPIIDEKLFYLANQMIKTFRRKTFNNYNGLFSNLVICGECGKKMTPCHILRADRKIKHQYYFSCNNKIGRIKCNNRKIVDSKLEAIIKIVVKQILDAHVDKDEIICVATKNILKSERLNLKIDCLKKNIDIHNKNIRNLYVQLSNNAISLEKFILEKDNEALLRQQYEVELEKIKQLRKFDNRKIEIAVKYDEFMKNFQNLFNEFIDSIVVYKNNLLVINFKCRLNS